MTDKAKMANKPCLKDISKDSRDQNVPLTVVCTIPEAGIMNKGINGKKGHSKVCRKMLE